MKLVTSVLPTDNSPLRVRRADPDDKWTQRNPMWLYGSPASGCISWLISRLGEIRIVVIESSEARSPNYEDPRERTICEASTYLAIQAAAKLYETELELAWWEIEDPDGYGCSTALDSYYDAFQGFIFFLDVRSLHDGRLVVAAGPSAEFPEDYESLRQLAKNSG